jgi:hypothetical protein
MAWGLLMPTDTEQGRRRMHLASVLRLLFGPMALLVLFHAESAAASPEIVSVDVPWEIAAVDAGDAGETKPVSCDLTDTSQALPPGSRAGTSPACESPAGAEREDAPGEPPTQADADRAPSDRAASDKAPSDRAAPMCGSNATSIAAPVDIPEVDRGHFEPLPCDAQRLLSLFRSPDREGGIHRISARESPPRGPQRAPSVDARNDSTAALALQLPWPERAAPSMLAAHSQGGLAWQPAHPSRIERPPSRRA